MDPALYRLTLFAHILGMIGFFMALSVYVFGLAALRRGVSSRCAPSAA
jgi:hypothetical protein